MEDEKLDQFRALLATEFLRGRKPNVRRTALIEDENGCWIWQGALTRGGYGLKTVNRRKTTAHRYIYEKATGSPVPDGFQIHHICGVRACSNPNHLLAVTKREHAILTGHLRFSVSDFK